MRQALITLIAPSGDATSWEARAELSRVIRQEGPLLTETTIDAEGNAATATITDRAIEVVAINEDATRLYFACRAEPGGSGAGEVKLYLLERSAEAAAGAGELTYVTTLPEPPANKNGRAGR